MGKPRYRIWNSIACLQKRSPKMPIMSCCRKTPRSDPQKFQLTSCKKRFGRLRRSSNKSAGYFKNVRKRAADCSAALAQGEGKRLARTHQMTSAVVEVQEAAMQTLKHFATATPNIQWGGRFLKISFPLPLWLLPIIIASEIKESLPCFPLDIVWAKVGSKQ